MALSLSLGREIRACVAGKRKYRGWDKYRKATSKARIAHQPLAQPDTKCLADKVRVKEAGCSAIRPVAARPAVTHSGPARQLGTFVSQPGSTMTWPGGASLQ